ncbi:hypothetical protein scyTo_0017304 [Scyliorhinus torazame]|uniref:Uncharacterized protein n=1 Tax=Scyliorhinus torazame TaxID=75743 RepID=A0A401PPU9_SCYTO|nr:hypothetical protein [Scyliorhinus torazame]
MVCAVLVVQASQTPGFGLGGHRIAEISTRNLTIKSSKKMVSKRNTGNSRLERRIWRRVCEMFLAVSVSAFLDRCIEEKKWKDAL